MARLMDYKLAISTAFHPQTDGETERVNQEVEAYLRAYCSTMQEKWAELIPMAEFVHNSRHHSARNTSPFYLMMGYHPPAIPEVMGNTNVPGVEQRLKILQGAREEALASHEIARQHMRQRITRGFTPFKRNDLVWLDSKNLDLGYPNRKLAPKREGPFKILEVLGPVTYRLQLPFQWKVHPVFHAALLFPYIQNDEHGPSFVPEPPDLIDRHEEQEIEAIVGHNRANGKRRKYRIRWKGFPSSDDQLMMESKLSNSTEILQAYKTAHHLRSLQLELPSSLSSS